MESSSPSIAQPTFELGKKSTELLLERIIQPNQPFQQYTLPVTLVKRDSTIPLK